VDAEQSTCTLLGKALRRRDYCPLCSVVPPFFAELSRPEGADGGTRFERRSHHHLALGAALWSGIERRFRPELKRTGTSWRVDETYVRVAGQWAVSVSSSGFRGRHARLLSFENAAAAKRFFRRVLAAANHPRPRVINVDGNPFIPRSSRS
jgi:hypothetical protein